MRHNSFQKIYASYIAPNPDMDVLWMDLKSDPYGSVIKFWNGGLGRYELIASDASTIGKHIIYADDVELPTRSAINFSGVKVLDNQPLDILTISVDNKEDVGVAQSLIDGLNLGDIVTHSTGEFAPALTLNENYVTDLEKSNLHAPGSDNQVASDFDIKDLSDSTSLRSTWSGKQDALGFTPENINNKKTTLTDSDTDYPTGKAVITALNSYTDNVAQELSYKVDKEAGKSLVAEEDIITLQNTSGINTGDQDLSGLVEKINGHSLVPDTEIDKLAEYPEFEDLGFSHTSLTDKNSEATFQHVDTTTVKPTLDEADKVALYDSVTGKVVLSDVLTQKYFTELAESLYSYGVVFDQNLSTTTLYRIGNQELHRTLPVQSGMRRCLVLDNGTVNYYTHPNNTLLKEDGITASVIDGTDGQLMVEVPEHWRKFTTLSDERFEVRLSMVEIPGYHKVTKFYVSAFEATVHRPTNKLSSVYSLSPDYRGGNNNAAWDGANNTLLGRPASSISLTNFRTYARNRGAKWNVLPYEQYKSVWYLYMVEYANTNVQLPVSAPDPTGLKTGGLGNGVTDANGTEWINFNGYNPFIPCGASITPGIGNLSGEKTYTVTNFGGAGVNRSFKVPSYRGIENIFGHILKHTDGVLVEVKTDADGGTSKLYTQSDPAMFADVITNYTYRGNLARTNGYIKKLLFGANGDILPTQIGGGTTTYFADYYETDITSNKTRCVMLSASAFTGANAGLSFAETDFVPAGATAKIGARLCYIP